MGKKTEEFKKARISSIAVIRAELIEDKKNVQKLAELQKISLEDFTAKTQQALADFTANTQIVLSQCDAVTKTIDAKIEALEKEMESIRAEQLTEKHFEGEYNTLKEQVEGMYASVRMFQKPMEESHEEESTTGNTSPETGKEEKETSVEETVTPEIPSETTAEETVTSETTMEETAASEPVTEEAQTTEELDTSSITEPEEDIMLEPAPEYITEETFTVKETVTDESAETAETINDEEFDSMYDDIIDTETEIPAESTSNTTIQVVESSVTPPTEQTAEQSNAPASIAELLNRASKINI